LTVSLVRATISMIQIAPSNEMRGILKTHRKPLIHASKDARAEMLRGIVADLHAKGITSVRTLAAELNERGVITPRGGIWHPTSTARLLTRLEG